MVKLTLAFVVAAILVAGCHTDPDFCEGKLANSCAGPDGASSDVLGGCTVDPQCSGPTAICDTVTRACVQCTSGNESACSGITPTCGTDDACHACTKHEDCSSHACLPDGSCGDDTRVAYVDPTGSDNTSCTLATPCTKVARAIATGRTFIKFHGTTDEAVSLDSLNRTLLADPGAKLTRSSNGLLLEIKGTSHVQIFDLEVAGASGATSPGISVPGGSAVTLSLTRVIVDNNQGGGITVSGGELSIAQSRIFGNLGGGISISGVGASFAITNNFIYRNGDASNGAYGGLNLGITTAGTDQLEFNTIVDNFAAINSAGVVCNVAAFTGANNIIARNALAGSTTAASAQTFGACTYPTSKVQSDTTGLNFVHADAPGPFDYKITSGSSAIDQATTASPTLVDNEGDVRPQGAAKDMGADEFKP